MDADMFPDPCCLSHLASVTKGGNIFAWVKYVAAIVSFSHGKATTRRLTFTYIDIPSLW